MTLPIVQKAFFTIAGTSKEGLPVGERSGGFGMAKMHFLLSNETIELETIRAGKKAFESPIGQLSVLAAASHVGYNN